MKNSFQILEEKARELSRKTGRTFHDCNRAIIYPFSAKDFHRISEDYRILIIESFKEEDPNYWLK